MSNTAASTKTRNVLGCIIYGALGALFIVASGNLLMMKEVPIQSAIVSFLLGGLCIYSLTFYANRFTNCLLGLLLVLQILGLFVAKDLHTVGIIFVVIMGLLGVPLLFPMNSKWFRSIRPVNIEEPVLPIYQADTMPPQQTFAAPPGYPMQPAVPSGQPFLAATQRTY